MGALLTLAGAAPAALPHTLPIITGSPLTGVTVRVDSTERMDSTEMVGDATADAAAKRKASATSRRAGAVTLRGSRAAVDHAYRTAKRRGIPFARTRREVVREAADGEYARLSHNAASYRLKGVTTPYVRPVTRAFVTSFAADYRRRCDAPLVVTSAMRPTSVHLANSVVKSVHPTGMAVDLRIPTGSCRAWMRRSLLQLERQGMIDATEERRPAHFHVVVFRAP